MSGIPDAVFCIYDCEPSDLGDNLAKYVKLPDGLWLDTIDLTLKIDYNLREVTMIGRGTIFDDFSPHFESREVINITGLDKVIKFIEDCRLTRKCVKRKRDGYRELKIIQGKRNLKK